MQNKQDLRTACGRKRWTVRWVQLAAGAAGAGTWCCGRWARPDRIGTCFFGLYPAYGRRSVGACGICRPALQGGGL